MRKEKTVQIGPDGGRDAGKLFHLREMPASQAEKWAWRAFTALANSGFEIPEEVVKLGVVGVFLVGYRAFHGADFAKIEPLLDEMMPCVQISPPPAQNMAPIVRPLIEDDVEEVATRVQLRKELLELHMGFTFAEAARRLISAAGEGTAKPT